MGHIKIVFELDSADKDDRQLAERLTTAISGNQVVKPCGAKSEADTRLKPVVDTVMQSPGPVKGTRLVPVIDDTPQRPGPIAEPAKQEKPKSKRRTKAQILADAKQEEEDLAMKAALSKAIGDTKKEEKPKAEAAPAANTGKSVEAPKTEVDPTVSVTMDDLRQALSSKVSSNRAAIKAQLNEAGVEKLTQLGESAWPAMLTFLEGLK